MTYSGSFRKKYQFLLFCLIGIGNTLFDIGLYVFLRSRGFSLISANIVSVSAAIIGSYLLNSRFTFKTKKWTLKTFGAYVAVTVFGLWVLQTGAIYLFTLALSHLPSSVWNLFGTHNKLAKIALPKLLATAVSFMWNYIWYSKVIFKQQTTAQKIIATLE